jgi:integrase
MARKKHSKSATFILNDPKSTVPTLILLTYLCKNEQGQKVKLKYSTRQSILPQDWDSYNYKALNNSQLNGELEKLDDFIEEYFEQFPRLERKSKKRNVIKAELKAWLDAKTERDIECERNEGLPIIENKISFFGEVEKLIEDAKKGRTDYNGKSYTEGSIRNWNKTLSILKEFSQNLNEPLSFDLNKEIYDEFLKFCKTRKHTRKGYQDKKGYSDNYVGSLIKDWKTFMERTKKFHNNTFYRSKDFATKREVINLPYLNDVEIDMLKNAEGLTDMQKIIRDRYIINLYCGLRISDMEKLNEEHIENGKIVMQATKTGNIVAIPVAEEVKDIIARYNGQLPKQYNRNVVNREIKKIGKKAGINEQFHFTRTIAGKKTLVTGLKHKFLSNHTARRSHATNLLKETDFLTAKSILGMSIKTMELYNKRTALENADMAKSLSIYSKKKATA